MKILLKYFVVRKKLDDTKNSGLTTFKVAGLRPQQNRDCPRMGAVPGFCGANQRSFLTRKLHGTAPGGPGDSPEFTTTLLIQVFAVRTTTVA